MQRERGEEGESDRDAVLLHKDDTVKEPGRPMEGCAAERARVLLALLRHLRHGLEARRAPLEVGRGCAQHRPHAHLGEIVEPQWQMIHLSGINQIG